MWILPCSSRRCARLSGASRTFIVRHSLTYAFLCVVLFYAPSLPHILLTIHIGIFPFPCLAARFPVLRHAISTRVCRCVFPDQRASLPGPPRSWRTYMEPGECTRPEFGDRSATPQRAGAYCTRKCACSTPTTSRRRGMSGQPAGYHPTGCLEGRQYD